MRFIGCFVPKRYLSAINYTLSIYANVASLYRFILSHLLIAYYRCTYLVEKYGNKRMLLLIRNKHNACTFNFDFEHSAGIVATTFSFNPV